MMDLALMTTDQKQQFFLNEALATIELLKNTTDPAEIDRLSRIINEDLTSVFNLMSPEEQKAQHDYLQGILDTAQDVANVQLDLAHDAVGRGRHAKSNHSRGGSERARRGFGKADGSGASSD